MRLRLCETREECEELLPSNVDGDVDMLFKFRHVGLFPAGMV